MPRLKKLITAKDEVIGTPDHFEVTLDGWLDNLTDEQVDASKIEFVDNEARLPINDTDTLVSKRLPLIGNAPAVYSVHVFVQRNGFLLLHQQRDGRPDSLRPSRLALTSYSRGRRQRGKPAAGDRHDAFNYLDIPDVLPLTRTARAKLADEVLDLLWDELDSVEADVIRVCESTFPGFCWPRHQRVLRRRPYYIEWAWDVVTARKIRLHSSTITHDPSSVDGFNLAFDQEAAEGVNRVIRQFRASHWLAEKELLSGRQADSVLRAARNELGAVLDHPRRSASASLRGACPLGTLKTHLKQDDRLVPRGETPTYHCLNRIEVEIANRRTGDPPYRQLDRIATQTLPDYRTDDRDRFVAVMKAGRHLTFHEYVLPAFGGITVSHHSQADRDAAFRRLLVRHCGERGLIYFDAFMGWNRVFYSRTPPRRREPKFEIRSTQAEDGERPQPSRGRPHKVDAVVTMRAADRKLLKSLGVIEEVTRGSGIYRMGPAVDKFLAISADASSSDVGTYLAGGPVAGQSSAATTSVQAGLSIYVEGGVTDPDTGDEADDD